jgi:hypothetical protein
MRQNMQKADVTGKNIAWIAANNLFKEIDCHPGRERGIKHGSEIQ